jgi:hypothetical protein
MITVAERRESTMRKAQRFTGCLLTAPVIAAIMAAAPGAAPGQHAPARTWRQVPSAAVPDRSGIAAIAAVTITDAWAAGWTPSGGLIEHWNGMRWRRVAAPAAHLVSIAASSPSDVWVVSHTSRWRLFHWDGAHWSSGGAGLPKGAGPGGGFTGMSDTPSAGAWAAVDVNVRYSKGTTAGAAVFRWEGRSWRKVGGDITVSGSIKPLWYADGAPAAVTPDNVWLGGVTDSGPPDGDSAHWNGSAWTVSNGARGTTPCCAVTVSPSGGQLWAYGSQPGVRTTLAVIALLAGARWRLLAGQPSGNDITIADELASDGLGNVWIVGPPPGVPLPGNTVLHWNGVRWAHQPLPGRHRNINDIAAVPGTHLVWAAGTYRASDGHNRPLFDITAP